MSGRFVEGNLLFEFDEARWTTLLRWDRHLDFLNGMKHAEHGKAVDFVGILDGKVPFLIEVKDYREHSRGPEKSLNPQDEFELKIRSTVAALFGLRWQEAPGGAIAVFKKLHDSRRPRLVLWQEDAQPQPRDVSRAARLAGSSAGVLRDQIKKKLRWLDAETIVTSCEERNYPTVVPGLVVKKLPPERKQKAEELVEILKGLNKTISQELRWKIDDCETEAQLDDLIARAPTVRDPWNLFKHRG
jgi:hypothetical protein